jgi:hypothetical protein
MYKMGRGKPATESAGWVASSFEQGQLVFAGMDGETLFEEIDGGFVAMWHYLNPSDALGEYNHPAATSALFIPGLTGEDIRRLCRGARLVKRARNEFESELELVLQHKGCEHRFSSEIARRTGQGAEMALILYKTKI